jgi:hypothetical protein
MSECYVCYDPCDNPAPCLCKTMHVHPSCMIIMKMYGQTECGVCKTPYPGPPVELIEEIPPEFEEEEEEMLTPPCMCFIVPTHYRGDMYHASELDKLMDLLRYVVLFMCIMFLFHLTTSPFTISIDKDWVPSFVMFMGLTCCCSAIGQTTRQKRHNLRQRIRRGAVIA